MNITEWREIMRQSEKRNLSMIMDLYELTMANGYFNDGDKETKVAFDVFYRRNPLEAALGFSQA